MYVDIILYIIYINLHQRMTGGVQLHDKSINVFNYIAVEEMFLLGIQYPRANSVFAVWHGPFAGRKIDVGWLQLTFQRVRLHLSVPSAGSSHASFEQYKFLNIVA